MGLRGATPPSHLPLSLGGPGLTPALATGPVDTALHPWRGAGGHTGPLKLPRVGPPPLGVLLSPLPDKAGPSSNQGLGSLWPCRAYLPCPGSGFCWPPSVPWDWGPGTLGSKRCGRRRQNWAYAALELGSASPRKMGGRGPGQGALVAPGGGPGRRRGPRRPGRSRARPSTRCPPRPQRIRR